MRLFVVDVSRFNADVSETPEAAYMTLEQLEERMQRDWEGVPTIRALDRAVLATVQISHVGQVITWRAGWIFCAEDEQSTKT